MKKILIFVLACTSYTCLYAEDFETFRPFVDDLVERSIIKYHAHVEDYELGRNLLRQEAAGMALTIHGVSFAPNYACQNFYTDITQNNPNYWACRIIENARHVGIISTASGAFRPETPATRAEMLAMVIKASGIQTSKNISAYEYDDDAMNWQRVVIATGKDIGLVSATKPFRPNDPITRAEAFVMVSNMYRHLDR